MKYLVTEIMDWQIINHKLVLKYYIKYLLNFLLSRLNQRKRMSDGGTFQYQIYQT